MTEQPSGELKGEAQSNDGYGCTCGAVLKTRKEFQGHQLTAWRDGGEHKSRGRVNIETGEITMPPWNERTDEQKRATRYGAKKDAPKSASASTSVAVKGQTEVLASATEIRLQPRFYSIDYSPTIRIAQAASKRLWGWPELPLGDFLDTIIYRYFKRCGVTLEGYYAEETQEEARIREEAVAAFQEQKE